MYFNIFVNDESRGRVNKHNEFLKLLKPQEIKKIFDCDAWEEI